MTAIISEAGRPIRMSAAIILQGFIDAVKERLPAGAQMIQSWLPIRCGQEAVLGALAVAGKAHVALAAIAGQAVEFVQAELPCPPKDHLRAMGVSMMLPSR